MNPLEASYLGAQIFCDALRPSDRAHVRKSFEAAFASMEAGGRSTLNDDDFRAGREALSPERQEVLKEKLLSRIQMEAR